MGPQRLTGQPRAVRELEVVHLREDDLDGEAVDLRAEPPVSRVDTGASGAHRHAVDAASRENCRDN